MNQLHFFHALARRLVRHSIVTNVITAFAFLVSIHSPGAVLPEPRVDLAFSEGSGISTANSGSLDGTGDLIQTDDYPQFSTQVPSGPYAPAGNQASIHFGGIADGQGGRAIDFGLGGDGTLGSFTAFTVCGWLNCLDLRAGFGGNRIVFALESANGAGIDLVQLANGALRIGINQWPDGANGGGPQSTAGRITVDPGLGATNWVFFAFTYDSAVSSDNARYYFGKPTQLAALDSVHSYLGGTPENGGLVEYSGSLTIGNFGVVIGARNETGPAGGSRVFRGLMDELKVYDRALTLEEVQRAQLNGAEPSAPVTILQSPLSQTVFEGQAVTLRVEASGSAPLTYQWLRNDEEISGATSPTYVIDAVTGADEGVAFKARVTNALGSVTSDPAVLTVVPETGHKVSLSFSEGGSTVTNRGNLGGSGVLVQKDDYPILSTNVPAGPNAPIDNIASMNFGVVDETQGGRAIDFTNHFGGTLGPMTGFTVSGWLNSADLRAGWGGNRIVFGLAAQAGPGFDVVHLGDGSLQLGVNQWPDNSPARSNPGVLTEDPENGPGNWIFFAISYDGLQSTANTHFYFGKPGQPAELDVTADYDQGPILQSGQLTIGNFSNVDTGARNGVGTTSGSRAFRGLIDEINVFNKVLTLEEVQAIQKAPAYRPSEVEPIVITTEPQDVTAFSGSKATFDVGFSGSPPYTIQWRKNDTDVAGANGQSLTLDPVSLADDGSTWTVVISNTAGSVTSRVATLTVIEDTGRRVALSFSEAAGTNTTSVGILSDSGQFAVRDAYPTFSTLVPTGAQAPSGNASSIDFGVIADGQGGRAIDFSNGFGNTLGAFDAFTITGWLNSRDLRTGGGGNRVVFGLAAPNGPGLDLVQLDDGSLQLGVNQWPDGSPARSTGGWITEDPEAGAANWVFFAVTYDGTQDAGNTAFYFGKGDQAAQPDGGPLDYARGPITESGSLTLGNFGSIVAARTAAGPTSSRVFRGLMDEINVYSEVLTLEEIQAAQKAPAQSPVVSPTLTVTRDGNELVLEWVSTTPLQPQGTSQLGSAWTDLTVTPVVDGTRYSLRLPITGEAQFVRLRGQ